MIKRIHEGRGFNMVEVTLAIAVMAIGMTGVMSLFPVGVNATRDSVGDSYAAEVADMFMTIYSENARKYIKWDSGAQALRPSTEEAYLYNLQDYIETTASDTGTGTAVPNSTIEYINLDKGVFRVCQGIPTDPNVVSYANIAIKDFNAGIRVWKKQVEDLVISGTPDVDVPKHYAARLNIEVSWPLEKDYAKRQKRYYVMELFNSNPITTAP